MRRTSEQRRIAATIAMALLVQPSVAQAQAGDGGVSRFYAWSRPVPAAGRVLRREALPDAMLPEGAARGERILYASTTDFGGERAVAVSGIVLLPKGKAPRGGWPVVAWAHGTTGTADVCAPSWTGYRDQDKQMLNAWLAAGFAVAATDYEGLGTPGVHPYMMLGSAARGVLDSVRAARRMFGFSRRVIIVGHSQGAHAAFGAGLLQRGYAPELDLRGVAVTGLPAEGGFAPLDTGRASAISRAAPIDPGTRRDPVRRLDMTRFDSWYVVTLKYFPTYAAAVPGFTLDDWVTPRTRAILNDFDRGCSSDKVAPVFAERPHPSALLKQDVSAIEETLSRWRRYPTPRFAVPVFLGIGRHDSATAPELSFNVARAACVEGSRMTVRFYDEATHATVVPQAQADILAFAAAAMAARALPGNCGGLAWPGRG
ncbi:lipase family protein [Sphingomonas sp. HF-S4]|uniref:Lipase family protein n=1 Tax=Sphingomonas agrestis TaxID=3080540 RepID=A0ABU3Y4T1_9SPHN|nr:lipase family protein [Sphingomonas sp. HF-S4]MDV3456102.1 lipase family protein [Sphingomonas sp. HF-S4]